MHTASTRTLASLAAALSVVAVLASCTYEELTGNVTITVSNIPPSADHIDLLLTDSTAKTYERHPSFGVGQYTGSTLLLTIKVENTGALTALLLAKDHDQTTVAQFTATGSYDGTTTLELTAPLVNADLDGTFGKPCLVGAVECSGTGLTCKKYTGSDKGICTNVCSSGATCSTAVTPAATCIAFPPTTDLFCQWECDLADGGASTCPAGLVCGAAISGKRYCQGSN